MDERGCKLITPHCIYKYKCNDREGRKKKCVDCNQEKIVWDTVE